MGFKLCLAQKIILGVGELENQKNGYKLKTKKIVKAQSHLTTRSIQKFTQCAEHYGKIQKVDHKLNITPQSFRLARH